MLENLWLCRELGEVLKRSCRRTGEPRLLLTGVRQGILSQAGLKGPPGTEPLAVPYHDRAEWRAWVQGTDKDLMGERSRWPGSLHRKFQTLLSVKSC